MRGKYQNSKKAHKTRNARKTKKTHINLHGGALVAATRTAGAVARTAEGVFSFARILGDKIIHPNTIKAVDTASTAFYNGFKDNLGKNLSLLKPDTYNQIFNLEQQKIIDTFKFLGGKAGSDFFKILIAFLSAYLAKTGEKLETNLEEKIEPKIDKLKKFLQEQEDDFNEKIKDLELFNKELFNSKKLFISENLLASLNSFHPNSTILGQNSPFITEIRNNGNPNPNPNSNQTSAVFSNQSSDVD